MAFNSGFSSFFSLQGQKERLSNVVSTYREVGKSIVNTVTLGASKKLVGEAQRIQANPTLGKTTRAATEFIANRPLTSASIVAVPASSAGRTFVASKVGALSATKKAVGGAALLVGGSTLVGSERARVGTLRVAEGLAPESLVKAGGQAGRLIDQPTLSGAGEFARENPVLTTVGLLGGALAAKGVVGTVANVVNTQAVRENSELLSKSLPATATLPAESLTKAEIKLKERELDLQAEAQKAQLALAEQRQKAEIELAKEQLKASQKAVAAPAATPTPTPVAATAPTPKKRKKKKSTKKKPAKKKPKRKPAKKRSKRSKSSKRKTYKRKKR